MANFKFTEALRAFSEGEIDWVADDIRILLVKTGNNAAAVQTTANFLADITLDEYAGANYARQALGTKSVAKSGTQAQMDAADAVFSSLGAAASAATGAIVYKHVTNDADSVPLGFIDTGGFPKNGTGSDFTVQFNPSGVLTFTAA